jgi:chemotaxis protein MotB
VRKKQHHEEHEEHVNHEAWVIPYADLLTLLMALFLVLWASSQSDLSKLKEVSAGFADQLGVSGDGQGAGGQGVLAGSSQPDVTTTVPPTPAQEAMAMAALRDAQNAKEAASEDQKQLQGVQQAITSNAAAAGTSQDLTFQLQQRGLVVSIVTEGVLFDAGSADLRPEGKAILDQIADELTRVPNDLAIEGHTDDQPISNGQYPSNWELSTARATNVLRYLVDHHGLSPKRLQAAGYGDERPLAPNTPTGRVANRRVDIAVLDLGANPTAPAKQTTTTLDELGGK